MTTCPRPSASSPAGPTSTPVAFAALGLSMGGEEALGAAARDDRVQAVVAEGATSRVSGDKAWLSEVHGFRGWLQEKLDALMYATADVLTEASPPVTLRGAAIQATPRPILLITAGTVADEAQAAAHIRSGSPGTVEVWSAGGAAHTKALAAQPTEWEARVLAFLDRAIGLGGGGS